jgi:hypothetical protein
MIRSQQPALALFAVGMIGLGLQLRVLSKAAGFTVACSHGYHDII